MESDSQTLGVTIRLLGEIEPDIRDKITEMVLGNVIIVAANNKDREFVERYNEVGSNTLIIPEGLYKIKGNAFKLKGGITRIFFPSSLFSIGDSAFDRCTRLHEIQFPHESALHKIGNGAFSRCSSLTKVQFPPSLAEIGTHTFEHCNELTDLVFPQVDWSLAGRIVCPFKIGYLAFGHCTKLRNFDFPPSLNEIGGKAFASCTGLTEIHFPSSLTRIGEEAFRECYNLKELYFPRDSQLDKIRDNAFFWCTRVTDVYGPPHVLKMMRGRKKFFSPNVKFHTLTLDGTILKDVLGLKESDVGSLFGEEKQERRYVDNAQNRKLGRAGKVIPPRGKGK